MIMIKSEQRILLTGGRTFHNDQRMHLSERYIIKVSIFSQKFNFQIHEAETGKSGKRNTFIIIVGDISAVFFQ